MSAGCLPIFTPVRKHLTPFVFTGDALHNIHLGEDTPFQAYHTSRKRSETLRNCSVSSWNRRNVRRNLFLFGNFQLGPRMRFLHDITDWVLSVGEERVWEREREVSKKCFMDAPLRGEHSIDEAIRLAPRPHANTPGCETMPHIDRSPEMMYTVTRISNGKRHIHRHR